MNMLLMFVKVGCEWNPWNWIHAEGGKLNDREIMLVRGNDVVTASICTHLILDHDPHVMEQVQAALGNFHAMLVRWQGGDSLARMLSEAKEPANVMIDNGCGLVARVSEVAQRPLAQWVEASSLPKT